MCGIERFFLFLSIFFVGVLATQVQDTKEDLKPLYRMAIEGVLGDCFYSEKENLEYSVMVDRKKNEYHVWRSYLHCDDKELCTVYSKDRTIESDPAKIVKRISEMDPLHDQCGIGLWRRYYRGNPKASDY